VPSRPTSTVGRARANVYAAGDCAEDFHVVTGEPEHVPLALTANRAGRAIGQTVTGSPTVVGETAGTAIVKAFDLGAARTGIVDEERARDAGFDPVSVTITDATRPHYYPGNEEIQVMLVADRETAPSWAGASSVATAQKRIDTVATALHGGLTVTELQNADLAYAPPFSPVWDPVLTAAKVLAPANWSDDDRPVPVENRAGGAGETSNTEEGATGARQPIATNWSIATRWSITPRSARHRHVEPAGRDRGDRRPDRAVPVPLSVDVERFAVDPAKPNLLATMPGSATGRCCTSATSTRCRSDADEWSFDPLGERGETGSTAAGDRHEGEPSPRCSRRFAGSPRPTKPRPSTSSSRSSATKGRRRRGPPALLDADRLDADACVIGEPTCEEGRHSVTVADRGASG